MARSQISDFLQVGRFHVLDVSFTIPPVLLPVYGFRSCTLPELTIEHRKIKQGNYEFAAKVPKSADVSMVTLEQGVGIFNSDFYDWTKKAVVGRMSPKNLLIVQFSRINPSPIPTADGQSSASAFDAQRGALTLPPSLSSGGIGKAFGNLEFAVRLPGRAWLLQRCRPARYKPGSDFDALSQEVSIAQLDLEVEEFEEYNLGI